MTLPRSRLMATLTILAVLCLGTVIGVALDRTLLNRRPDNWRGGGSRGGGPPSPFGFLGNEAPDSAERLRMRTRVIGRMRESLTLTDAQATALDSVFAHHESQLDSIRRLVRPRLDSLSAEMRAGTDGILTPEQRTKLTEIRKQRAERRRRADSSSRR